MTRVYLIAGLALMASSTLLPAALRAAESPSVAGGRVAPPTRSDPLGPEARDAASSFLEFGQGRMAAGDTPTALAAFEQALRLFRGLAQQEPGQAADMHSVGVVLEQIGSAKTDVDGPGALAAYQEALDVVRALAFRLPENVQLQHEAAGTLQRIGDLKAEANELPSALKAFEQSYDLDTRSAARDGEDPNIQHDVIGTLHRIASLKRQLGDATALAAYENALDLDRRIAARQGDDPLAQRDVAATLLGVGDLKSLAGDSSGARKAFAESLVLCRALAAASSGDEQVRRLVAIATQRNADLK